MSKKTNKKAVVTKELSQSELQKLAHMGTKEAIEKIENYLKIENDSLKKAQAQIALDECEFMYYEPLNEKEEEDFMLCELIRRRERGIDEMFMKMESLRAVLEKSALEGKVHEKVLAKHKNKREKWQYNWMPDFVSMEAKALQEIEESIAYDEAWVAEAKKMITTARYKNIPARYMESLQFDFDDEEIFEENKDCFDCEDDCSLCGYEDNNF